MSYSVFRMCDNDTNRLIITLAKLSKERIYKVVPRTSPVYTEEFKGEPESPSSSKRKKASGMQKGSNLEKQYGHLYVNSYHFNKWM